MLVKFLSFTASVIGTARYKVILLSCLILVFSGFGIAGVAAWRGNAGSAASKMEKSEAEDTTQQQGSPQLRNNRKQAIQNGNEFDTPENPPSSGTQSTPSTSTPKPTATDPKTQKPVEITLSKAEISVVAGEASELVTVSSSHPADVQWKFTVDEGTGIRVTTGENAEGTVVFRVHADQTIDKNSPHTVIIQVLDAQNTVLASKTISIIIQ
jgi:hypothetical protein